MTQNKSLAELQEVETRNKNEMRTNHYIPN